MNGLANPSFLNNPRHDITSGNNTFTLGCVVVRMANTKSIKTRVCAPNAWGATFFVCIVDYYV